MTIKSLDERLKKHIINHPSGCWFWNGAHINYSAVIYNPAGQKRVKPLLLKKYRPEVTIDGNLKSGCGNHKCINPFHIITREEAFNNSISINKETDCWEWTGQLKEGYGCFSFQGKEKLVHRVMYERHKGAIPPKHNICHSCDNPKCVNPKHLWLGTQADNILDMIKKGRDRKAFGEKNHAAKITEDDVKNIRLKYKEGMNMSSISRLLNFPYPIVLRVCKNETWKHVK